MDHPSFKLKQFYNIYLIVFCILISNISAAQPDNYEVISVCDLDLNRIATSLTSTQLATVSPAHKGFIWNEGDNETLNFRPQGITDIFLDCRKYIGVSWYGRKDLGWENRGVRVSFVDISDMNSISYRHVLLVDENYNTFVDMHGGGIHYLNGKLYVPDTRSSSNQRIYEFDLNDIKRVPNEDLDDFYNYRYIVKRIATYHLPIQPSCISYDWDSEEFLIATFKNLCNVGCVYNPETSFSWFETSSVNASSSYHVKFFDRTQGIASIDDYTDSSKKMIWTSQSYGRDNPSYLYATTYNRNPNNLEGQIVDIDQLDYEAYPLPPGLEDLHFEQDKDTLWTLTEFGPNEGSNNNRLVFAFSKANILPPGYVLPSIDKPIEGLNEIVRFFPNPNPGNFFIDIGILENVDLMVIDEIGREVYHEMLNQGISELSLGLSSGIYITRIANGKRRIYSKIVVE